MLIALNIYTTNYICLWIIIVHFYLAAALRKNGNCAHQSEQKTDNSANFHLVILNFKTANISIYLTFP